MENYNEAELRLRVDAALKRIRTLLDNTRHPQYAADVPHRYGDKFQLAEFLTRVSIVSLVQCLGNIGLSDEGLSQLRAWAKTRSVTLRLKAREGCKFLREEVKKVESAQEYVTETRSFLGTKSTKVEKVVTTVTEYFWSFEFDYELVAFQGNSEDAAISLLSRRGRVEIKTATQTTPRPQTVVRPAIDVDLTWLLGHTDPESRVSFAIDRAHKSCHTPRRNRQIDEALRAFDEMYGWCARVRSYFDSELFPAQQDHGLDLSAINDKEIFVPVVPLFEGHSHGSEALDEEGDVLPLAYMNAFLEEQQRSLSSKCGELTKVFPRDSSVISAVEASLLVIVQHARQVCQQFAHGVNYIEQMLQKQLIAAIGKELTPVDFNSYMDFHARKLVKAEFRPQPFSHAIRRPEHDPEGTLSLEAAQGSAMPDPVSTTVSWSQATRPMSFALDASTRVSFMGDRFLHAWLSHQFSGSSGLSLSLVARARQFSSFILLVGRIASADVFEPKHAIIIQNKDLLKIPLMLEQIPTPKEFRDAIESLSPEQQRFAKAFRGMQLESTLFGVCVVQIKPQLETLLKLDADSLTKEIKLTQELLNLFIEYQIPSDLLSYDGDPAAPSLEKLSRVKEYVARMQEMIELSKKREVDEAREREALRLAEANRTPMPPQMASYDYGPPPPAPGFGPPPPMGGAMPMSAPSALAAPSASPRSASVTRSGAVMPSPSSGAAPPPRPAAAPPPPPPPPPPAQPAAQPVSVPSSASATHVDQSPRPTAASGQDTVGAAGTGGEVLDYTKIPGELDKKFESLDEDGALRPTILNPGDVWTRTSQKGLLSSPVNASLSSKEQKEEKNRAFDLLDALSKSGALPVEHASLHVIIAATHCFDKTLLDTVIQGNVNPIEKVERSLTIVATTIHRRPASELLNDDQRERFLALSPRLGSPEIPSTPAESRGGKEE